MKQLRLNLRPPEKAVSLEIQVPAKKTLFNFKRMGKEILNLNKGLAKSLISQLSAEDTMMRFALEAEAVKAFKKSELRRHLNYLSNKLMIELNKELKGVEIDTNMLRSFIRSSLTYLSVLQELMGFNTRLSPRSFRPTSPTRSDRGLKRKPKAKMSLGKNPDDFIEIQQAEALEEIGIHRRSDKLSQNFARRMNKVKPSQRFAFEQLVYCQIQCLLDICAYADS